MTTYKVKKDTFHYQWNNAHKPVLTIKSGDSVHFEINEVTSWQITKRATAQALASIDLAKLYPLAGPIYVEGAEPRDALSIEIKEIKTGDWGWSAIMPGLGLLPEFQKNYLKIWDLSKGRKFTTFKNGVKVPVRPFCGVMGVAPKERGAFDVLPPGKHGGNMDIKHLTIGSILTLPVFTKGALFSVGDLHAAMGDGEVCVTAIECPGEVRLKFELIKGETIQSPRFITSKERGGAGYPRANQSIVTTGIGPELLEATRSAVRNMIEYLGMKHGLNKEEAYVLCSVAADLKIHEVVDAPNWVVGLWIQKSILGLK